MPPLDVADAVCGVIGGVTDEAQLAVCTDTDLRTDVEVASSGAAANSDVAKWTSCISDRSRFFTAST